MIPYIAQLLDMTINNAAIPEDCKNAMVVTICNGGEIDR